MVIGLPGPGAVCLRAVHEIDHVARLDVWFFDNAQIVFEGPDPGRHVVFGFVAARHTGEPTVLFTGIGEGEGYTLNLPIMPGAGDEEYRRVFGDVILPRIDEFKPEFVLISAGFDAHRRDPLAPLSLETESYGWMTDELLSVADRSCDGRLLSILEGGYDLDALGESVALHLRRLVER